MSDENGLPAEAERDALAELDRMRLAETFDPIESAGPNPLAPIAVPQDERDNEFRSTIGAPKSLEDLYAEHPDIGGGIKYLRVIRRQPPTYQGQRIAGVLADLHEQISMNEFIERFGGGTYEILVIGASRGVLDGDEPKLRTLRVLRMDLPGKPVLTSLQPQSDQEKRSMPGSQFAFGGDQQVSAAVELEKLKSAERDKQRADQERQRLQEQIMKQQRGLGATSLLEIDQVADKRAQEVRQTLLETLNSERQRIQRLTKDIEDRDARIRELQESLFQEQQKVGNRLREVETASEKAIRERYESQIGDIKKAHEDEMRRRMDEHNAAINKLADQNAREIASITQRRDDERKLFEQSADREREKLREDSRRREEQLIQDNKARADEAARVSDQRIKDLERSYQREIDSLKLASAREVDSIRTSETAARTLAQQSFEIQIQSMRSDLSRIEARNASLESETAALRAQVNKPAGVAIKEACDLAALTGWKHPDDIETPEAAPAAEEPFSWQRSLVGILKGAVEKAPEVLRGIEEARVANQAARSGVPQQQRVPAGYHQVQQQMQQTQAMVPASQYQQMPTQPMPVQQQMRRGYRPAAAPGMAPPPAWGQAAGPMADPASSQYLPPPGPPNPNAVAYHPPPRQSNPVGSQGKPIEHAPAPVSGQEPGRPTGGFVPFESPQEQASAEQQQSPLPPPQPPPVHQQQSEAPRQAQVTESDVSEFVDQLETAVVTGIVSPARFAKEFVGKVGPEATKAVLTALTADQFVDQLSDAKGGNTPLATRDGRKYVRELWDEAGKSVGG